MDSVENVARVTLRIPDSVRETLRRAHALAEGNESAKDHLSQWIEGVNGPVLLARRLDRDPTTGAFHATLEFTERFAEFLAALRAGKLDGHVG